MLPAEFRWNWWTVVIGDVHGCREELVKLIKEIDEEYPWSRLIFLGDLVDRGPDSRGVLEVARGLKEDRTAFFLRGNHEDKHLAFHQREIRREKEGVPNLMTMTGEQLRCQKSFTEEDFQFMEEMRPFLRFRTSGFEWIATHAGVPVDLPVEEQRIDRLVRTRYVSAQHGGYRSGKTPFSTPEGCVPWYTMWKGPENVVFGHDVKSLDTPFVHPAGKDVVCVGIDTGCVFGGHLTAMIIPPDYHPQDNPVRFHQVRATREHVARKLPGLDVEEAA